MVQRMRHQRLRRSRASNLLFNLCCISSQRPRIVHFRHPQLYNLPFGPDIDVGYIAQGLLHILPEDSNHFFVRTFSFLDMKSSGKKCE